MSLGFRAYKKGTLFQGLSVLGLGLSGLRVRFRLVSHKLGRLGPFVGCRFSEASQSSMYRLGFDLNTDLNTVGETLWRASDTHSASAV